MKYNRHPGSAHAETASCLRALSRFTLDLGLKPVLSAPGNSNDWGELRAASPGGGGGCHSSGDHCLGGRAGRGEPDTAGPPCWPLWPAPTPAGQRQAALVMK